ALSAANCQTGALLGTTQSESADKEHVLTVLGASVSNIRKKLGESLASIEKFNVPVEKVTTSSLEALRAYSLGLKYMALYEHRRALEHFERAVGLDPNFASAYMRLAHEHEYLNQGDLLNANIERAYALRARVSERERFSISNRYFSWMYGDLEKAMAI